MSEPRPPARQRKKHSGDDSKQQNDSNKNPVLPLWEPQGTESRLRRGARDLSRVLQCFSVCGTKIVVCAFKTNISSCR